MIAGEGDLLPVSALPVDGTFPTGHRAVGEAQHRRRRSRSGTRRSASSAASARWSARTPRSARRSSSPTALDGAPADVPVRSRSARKDLPGHAVHAPGRARGLHRLRPVRRGLPGQGQERGQAQGDQHGAASRATCERGARQLGLLPRRSPSSTATLLAHDIGQGRRSCCEPLFEFSGACAGCGETPYLKLLTQLFGDRLLIANATGCSSIYGGNLPTTPWTINARGPRPGLGQLAVRGQRRVRPGHAAGPRQAGRVRPRAARAAGAGGRRRPGRGDPGAPTSRPRTGIEAQRERVAGAAPSALRRTRRRRRPRDLLDAGRRLVRKSVWIVGGDGWAYDIGFGGLDHVLASGANVNILVLDTEVYSNTGGQASKATPRGAVAKFAAGGKPTGKKDLGLMAMTYGNVYVAQVAMGANDMQTRQGVPRGRGLRRAVADHRLQPLHRPRLSTWRTAMDQQKDAVQSGHWPLFRYNPRRRATASTRSSSTRRRRASRSRSSSTTRRASPCWPRPTRSGPSELLALAAGRTSTSAGATTSSWPACAASPAPAPRRTGPGTSPEEAVTSTCRTTLPGAASCAARWSPRPSPLYRDLDTLGAPGGRRGRGGGAALAVRGADRPTSSWSWTGCSRRPRTTPARRSRYFPELDDYNTRARTLPGPHQPGQAGAVGPGDRQPQRHHPAAAGSRYAKRIQRRRRRRPRAERLHRGHRPARSARPSVEDRYLDLVADVRAAVSIPAGGQARARSSPPWPTSPSGSMRPAPTGWCCSTASTSPTSTWRRSTSCPALELSQLRGAAPAAALDRHPVRPGQDRRWPPPPASTPAWTRPRCCWPGRTWP